VVVVDSGNDSGGASHAVGDAGSWDERRTSALELYDLGLPQAQVSRRLGVSRTTAMRWKRLHEACMADPSQRGKRKKRGRRALASDGQLDLLDAALREGPRRHGWTTDTWTLTLVSQLADRLIGVKYHRGHVWRVMHKLGWVNRDGRWSRGA